MKKITLFVLLLTVTLQFTKAQEVVTNESIINLLAVQRCRIIFIYYICFIYRADEAYSFQDLFRSILVTPQNYLHPC